MTQVGSACRAGAWQIVYTRACELMHASLKQVLALWALMMLSVTAAVGDNPRVFIDAAACVASGAHSASDCRHAERNARAEFSEKAPRFPTPAAGSISFRPYADLPSSPGPAPARCRFSKAAVRRACLNAAVSIATMRACIAGKIGEPKAPPGFRRGRIR